jgi:hypothetical protein
MHTPDRNSLSEPVPETALPAPGQMSPAVVLSLIVAALALLEQRLREAVAAKTVDSQPEHDWVLDELRYRLTKELPARLVAGPLPVGDLVGLIEAVSQRCLHAIKVAGTDSELLSALTLALNDLDDFLYLHGHLRPNFYSDPRHYDHERSS